MYNIDGSTFSVIFSMLQTKNKITIIHMSTYVV
jgi:hypothetical protein